MTGPSLWIAPNRYNWQTLHSQTVIAGCDQVWTPTSQEGSLQPQDRSSAEGGANDSNSRSASRARANRRYDLTGETGSYRYMAPEVFRHEPYNSKARADLLT